jgi:hypothetical protein
MSSKTQTDQKFTTYDELLLELSDVISIFGNKLLTIMTELRPKREGYDFSDNHFNVFFQFTDEWIHLNVDVENVFGKSYMETKIETMSTVVVMNMMDIIKLQSTIQYDDIYDIFVDSENKVYKNSGFGNHD